MISMACCAVVLFACAILALVAFSASFAFVMALLFVIGGTTAAAIAVILTRSVEVGAGRLIIDGVGGVTFELAELTPPLASGLFGVRVGTEATRRRVFAQIPALASALQVRLPEYAPQLRPTDAFPILVPGKIGSPVAYSVVAAIGALMGTAGVLVGLNGGGPGEPPAVVSLVLGSILLGVGVTVIWLTAFRVERRVEIYPDRVVRMYLLGQRVDRLEFPVASTVVVESRSLPRSRLEREVHRIRLVVADGSAHEISPALVSFPDYGSAGEGALARRRASRFAELDEISTPVATLYRTGRTEMAAWDHHVGRVSGGGSPERTFIFRQPVGGRHAVVAENGVVSLNTFHNELALVFGDRIVVAVRPDDETPVRWTELDQAVVRLDAGFRRIVVGLDDGPQQTETFDAVVDSRRTGWVRLDVIAGGVLDAPWLAATEAIAAELFSRGDDQAWNLFAAGALGALLTRVEAADASDSLVPQLLDLLALTGRQLEREL